MKLLPCFLYFSHVLAKFAQCGKELYPSLINADAEYLIAGLERGLFTSVDLVKAYSARISEVNGTLHMVTEINPDALSIAAEMDALREKGTILSPLHGIPLLVKNNIATDDQMQTTAGSWGLWNAKVSEDSTVVAKLRKAGVIILGKTNLSQWANFRSENSSNGWSAHGGQTYGAHYPGQDPSGSSSGSGVASDLGLALACLGTETSGSIMSPSDVNNLVGIKPTVGLTSRFLVIPISEHQDTVGPMARTVKDAAYVLQAIAGKDPHDNYTSAIPNGGKIPDYVAACDYNAFAGARIGVARNVLELWSELTDEPVMEAFNKAIKLIEEAGATIFDANFTAFDKWLDGGVSLKAAGADFETGLSKYFAALSSNPNSFHNLTDVRDFTQSFGPEAWPERDTATWDIIIKRDYNNTDPRFWPDYLKNLFYGDEGGILGALERTNANAILLPTQLSPAIPALVGSPIITVPMGFYPSDWNLTLNPFGNLVASAPKIPFGLSFMGARFSESDLIGYAYAYEQRTMRRHDSRPYIVPNIELGDVIKAASLDQAHSSGTCSKEWIERCQEVSETPRKLKAQGVVAQKNWWTLLLERST